MLQARYESYSPHPMLWQGMRVSSISAPDDLIDGSWACGYALRNHPPELTSLTESLSKAFNADLKAPVAWNAPYNLPRAVSRALGSALCFKPERSHETRGRRRRCLAKISYELAGLRSVGVSDNQRTRRRDSKSWSRNLEGSAFLVSSFYNVWCGNGIERTQMVWVEVGHNEDAMNESK